MFRRYSRVYRDDANELRFFQVYFIENRERYYSNGISERWFKANKPS